MLTHASRRLVRAPLCAVTVLVTVRRRPATIRRPQSGLFYATSWHVVNLNHLRRTTQLSQRTTHRFPGKHPPISRNHLANHLGSHLDLRWFEGQKAGRLGAAMLIRVGSGGYQGLPPAYLRATRGYLAFFFFSIYNNI